MNFLKRRFAHAPEGAAALFFIQIFSTLGFAVLYSTLVLYATKHLHLGVKEATTLMGVFGAFNYGLHLFGGYLGGRFLSNRKLFVGSMAVQVIGCACIATGTLALFYVGLALFLTGSGLNVTCINMMLTQRFTPDDPRREGAFLWNYAGSERRLLCRVQRRRLFPGDPELLEPLHLRHARQLRRHYPRHVYVEDAGRPQHTAARRDAEAVPGAPVRRYRHSHRPRPRRVVHASATRQHRNDTQDDLCRGRAHVDLSHGSPSGSTRAAEHDGLPDSDHWLADVLVALSDGTEWPDAVRSSQRQPDGRQRPDSAAMDSEYQHGLHRARRAGVAALFTRMRARGWRIDIPKQFAASLLLMALAFFSLTLGIKLAGPDGKSAFIWLFLNYVLQSIGELLIMPIGYAMIGKLAPRRYRA